ncbi:sterile alpha motif domain-containing protein 9-like [Mastacembelus armatus]|uniref:sterile alpha motif domain-containing protein 9-like n=1 Tax=Mastacembelus armatus TaxID=205130 RepID=UPI000E455A09|nr:sterile alpha motif domain-containing protein 9-like [Mastacembelus armatus]XP_026151957.1 sterile alpha motif domain-containing protein 9-like [Mastacembelus armatus]XP_026151958.1 sterile alpha motif domain-containing protein 9-like [Mastacembelus armatus]
MADHSQMKNEEAKLSSTTNINDRANVRNDQLRKDHSTSSENQRGRLCKPYPFNRYHDTYRYIESSILDTIESGPSNLIEPCHEYKAFINTTDENKMIKFIFEVIRFAAACMNSRTNGTIHFGIGDMPDFTHGQVLGVVVEDKEAYANELKSAIERCFEYKHKDTAQMCIKPPRFVEVLYKDMTSSDKCVIEVDIVPDSTICEENIYHTFNSGKTKAKKKEKQFYVRDGGSSKDLYPDATSGKDVEKNYQKFIDSVAHLSQRRKTEEEKHLSLIKSSTQASYVSHHKLREIITGGTLTLDKSNFERYVIVTNKSHVRQFESLGFLVELNPTAVLDFHPESAKDGLLYHFKQQCTVNVHSPAQYKITEAVEDIANKLKLTRSTSWVLCNSGIEDEAPSDIGQWLMDKGASVQDVISFLCRKDVLPNKRFLVIFLLLSTVSETTDPLLEAFNQFHKELGGTDQILCICDNERCFTSWKDLIEVQYKIDISGRCIYKLSLAAINGTILSLFSKCHRSKRFLPHSVLLKTDFESSLNTLDVLCMNQCEGGNEDKILIEENFYNGGKPSWCNFYCLESREPTTYITRDKLDLIKTIIPDLLCQRKPCVLFNLLHAPGCGGTTLAMHVLWALRDRFRCAVLKDSNADFAEVANQVVQFLMHDQKDQSSWVPILLMIDDFNNMEKVSELQQLIEHKCTENNIKSTQIVLLNCMRAEPFHPSEENRTFLGNDLSYKEQKHLTQIPNCETFYSFMMTKPQLKPEYINSVVHNTLKSFDINQKYSQLLAVLTLVNVYNADFYLPVNLCKTFISLEPKPLCGTDKVEELFGKFSNLINIKDEGEDKAVKMIHPKIAQCCFKDITQKTTKADVTKLLKLAKLKMASFLPPGLQETIKKTPLQPTKPFYSAE